jgi:hypothetical protein
MAKALKKFKVQLYPAHKSHGGYFCFSFQVCGGDIYPTKTFEAASVKDVLEIVTGFARDHKAACHAAVNCLSKPKPPGFDAATERLYFNMDKAEVRS